MGPQGYIVVHGHFYQPPRENPWIEEIELEESAAPYHDWNERIVRECYWPNACSRICDGRGRILDIVNNYAHISYDFGPTILSWLERNYPKVYRGVLSGDALAEQAVGRGGAMACAYNHAILPLCNDRDLETQIVWGKADFRHRFGRPPQAMWLPECAVNARVLAALARHALRFCVLAPTQAEAVRPLGGGEWQDVSAGTIDPTQPYRCFLDHDATVQRPFVDAFFYDGAASHAVSFGNVLVDARRLVETLAAAYHSEYGRPQVLSVAVDGETFGHHKPLGNMALAYALKVAAPQAGLEVTNYAAFLEGFPPRWEVRLKPGPNGEGTAWSCAHGVGRWLRDCGCSAGSRPGWNQAWRGPLRQSFDLVRDQLALLYEQEAGELLREPWEARNGYIEVMLDRRPESVERFFEVHGLPGIGHSGRLQALKLLEMQRHCLLMYTSCGWFHADLAGLETVQNIQYCARALELARELGVDLEPEFLDRLGKARSNLPTLGDGRRVHNKLVRPAVVSPERVVNHFAIVSAFTEGLERPGRIYHYKIRVLDYDKRQRGAMVLALGVVELTSGVILETCRYLFATTFLGGYFFRTGVRRTEAESAAELRGRLFELLDERPGKLIALLEDAAGTRLYSLRDVFKEEKKGILESLVKKELEDYYASFDHVFETTRDAMEEMVREGLVLPEEFQVAAGKVLSRRLAAQVGHIQARTLAESKIVESELRRVVDQARLFGLELDTGAASRHLGRVFLEVLCRAVSRPRLEQVQGAGYLLDLAGELGLRLELTESQNLYHEFLKERFAALAEAARGSQPHEAAPLAEAMLGLGEQLGFNVDAYRGLLVAEGRG